MRGQTLKEARRPWKTERSYTSTSIGADSSPRGDWGSEKNAPVPAGRGPTEEKVSLGSNQK